MQKWSGRDRLDISDMLDISDISATYGVLIHIVGGEDMTLGEVAAAGERIVDKLPDIKRVIWGARVDSSLTGRARIMAVLTGVKSPLIEGKWE
jgi:cell division protein FtsZ